MREQDVLDFLDACARNDAKELALLPYYYRPTDAGLIGYHDIYKLAFLNNARRMTKNPEALLARKLNLPIETVRLRINMTEKIIRGYALEWTTVYRTAEEIPDEETPSFVWDMHAAQN